MNNFIIKLNAIIVTIIVAVILAIIWLTLIPIRIVCDMITLFIEIMNNEDSYYHNYIGISFVRNINHIKNVYKKMIDEYTINDYLKDCSIK